MYARQTSDGRRSHGVKIPANYSGSAFGADDGEEESAAQTTDVEVPDAENASVEVTAPVAVRSDERETESAGLFHLFGSGGGGIGLEELLILGLVLLISQNDTKDDLAFLLLLLLFIR